MKHGAVTYQDIARLFRPAGAVHAPDVDGRYTYTFNADGDTAAPDRITLTPEIAELVGRKAMIDKVVSDLQYVRGPFQSADELRDRVVAALVGGGFRKAT